MAIAVADTLRFLLGDWAIERVIEDHHAAATVRFSGSATVEATPGGADYREVGQVSTAGHSGPARRSLRLRGRGDGTVAVDFQDGRPFLDLDLCAGHSRADHPCRADIYQMAFEVLGPDALLERWRVIGPAKDYTAETVWRRR